MADLCAGQPVPGARPDRAARAVAPVVAVVALGLALGGWVAATAISSVGRSSQFAVAMDLRIILWAPLHGLAAGFNPYAASSGYLTTYGVDVPATLHAPSLLVLTAPAMTGDLGSAYAVMTVVSVAVLWLAAAIAVPPTSYRSATVTVVLGALLTMSGPAQESLLLGQVTPFVVLGLALVVRWPHRWPAVVGVALLCTTPQFALPASILLLGLGVRRAVLWGWLATAVLSLPMLAWSASNAGGVGPLVRSLVTSLGLSDATGNATNRVDVAGAYADGGTAVTVLLLLATVAGAVLAHRRGLVLTPVTALVLTSWCLLAVYSMPYSLCLALLVAVPVVAAGRRGSVEAFTLGLIALCCVAALPVSSQLADLTGLAVGRVWLLLSLGYQIMLVGVVASGAARIARSSPAAVAPTPVLAG